jgi:hypothetical protein
MIDVGEYTGFEVARVRLFESDPFKCRGGEYVVKVVVDGFGRFTVEVMLGNTAAAGVVDAAAPPPAGNPDPAVIAAGGVKPNEDNQALQV